MKVLSETMRFLFDMKDPLLSETMPGCLNMKVRERIQLLKTTESHDAWRC